MTAWPAGFDPRTPPADSCHGEDHCITCSDEGIPYRVLEPDADGLALCAGEDGREATVETTLVGPVAPGDSLLVHAGVALVRLNPPAIEGEVA